MEKITVSDEIGTLRPNVTFELMAHAAYVGDFEAIKRACRLLHEEDQRCREVGFENYRLSALANNVIMSMQKRITQQISAGLVATAMVELGMQGKKMSLNAAAKHSKNYTDQHGQVTVYLYRNGKWEPHRKSLLSNDSDIQQNFRDYCSVAHICAALVSFPNEASWPMPFEPNPEAHGRFVSTVIAMQTPLQNATTFNKWGLQELVVPEGFNFDRFPPFFPCRNAHSSSFA